MKTYQSRKQPNLHSVVIPFKTRANDSPEELFDDCPVCQELKKQIESGAMEEISIPVDEDLDPVTG